MGRASFDDFYNDNEHHYLYNEKIQNIYNWRNGVFSRSRDYQRMQTLSAEQLHQFGLSPDEGGFLLVDAKICRKSAVLDFCLLIVKSFGL
jgi:hypothetical protein